MCFDCLVGECAEFHVVLEGTPCGHRDHMGYPQSLLKIEKLASGLSLKLYSFALPFLIYRTSQNENV